MTSAARQDLVDAAAERRTADRQAAANAVTSDSAEQDAAEQDAAEQDAAEQDAAEQDAMSGASSEAEHDFPRLVADDRVAPAGSLEWLESGSAGGPSLEETVDEDRHEQFRVTRNTVVFVFAFTILVLATLLLLYLGPL